MDLTTRTAPTIAITVGDPSGIGPEVTIKALQAESLPADCHLVVVGHRPSFEAALKQWGQDWHRSDSDQFRVHNRRIQFIEVASEIKEVIALGQACKAGGIVASASIREVTNLAMQGLVDAIVTGPINKKALHRIGLTYPGQTEYLAELSQTRTFAMMLVGDKIRVVMATTHVPLADVSRHLSTVKIIEKIELTHQALKTLFGIDKPRIAVTALNPHAGDEGCFGSEEPNIIEPAILQTQRKSITVSGPHPADSLFPRVLQGHYDAVVAMYHDQGIIPVKLEAFGHGINMTLGLPFIRTSVDHGTAYDIAGKGMADPKSMIVAITMAAQFAHNKSAATRTPAT